MKPPEITNFLQEDCPTPALLEEVTEDGPPNSCINLLSLPLTCPCGCLARASASPSTHGGPGQWMAGAAHPMWKPQEALAGALLVTVGSPPGNVPAAPNHQRHVSRCFTATQNWSFLALASKWQPSVLLAPEPSFPIRSVRCILFRKGGLMSLFFREQEAVSS